jgi:DNA-binding winged helix-turn-helix (wHTH) protein
MTTGLIRTSEPEAETSRDPLGSSGRQYIRLGPIQVDLKRNEVTKDGSRLKLSGTTYRVLLALLERPEQIVTRDTIRACVWPSDAGIDYTANVNTTINKLRRALGDSVLTKLYIETIPRKGYALVGHPEISDQPNKLLDLHAMQPSLSHGSPGAVSMSQLVAKSRFWPFICVSGLFLIGMLFGIGMSVLWISNHR